MDLAGPPGDVIEILSATTSPARRPRRASKSRIAWKKLQTISV